ncbi:acyl-CoA carboxylase subunit beta [Virgibacillus sp. MSP4-1]|uniref:acyl-CoA carboxylase subunit beta n=1 Tax=Virgibacillus sp. MSP4-1 TaxID=2700081 RepID=UPI00039BC663|nr:acyl-CoA carboxylase subunit beta [Virgibacillus sp. MSP4-1]QHS21976.1 acyl-CoA carboxylase subunit beta [Virgibacillus sp. MSP4-1]
MEREWKVLAERERIHKGGKSHDKLEKAGKRFVRDRLKLYFDEERPFYETGLFAQVLNEKLPADGVVTGTGKMDDRIVYFMASDFTVKAGSMGKYHSEKVLRIQEAAIRGKRPIVYMIDSSGGRIDEAGGYHVEKYSGGKIFYNHSILSGRVPQIAVLYGPCFAGTAYMPVFSDFTIMVDQMAGMAIASPRMVQMATTQKVDIEELGGSHMHATKSGSADFVAESEEHAAEIVKKLMTYLPDHFDAELPEYPAADPKLDPKDIDNLIPQEPNRAYDVHKLIDSIVDADSFLEVKKDYAKELVTGFARLNGKTVGIVANQPMHKGGAIFPESSDKGAKFVWTCDAYNIPLLYLCDTPGFMVGTKVEQEGILRKGRNFIFASSCANVPKLCVIVRKAYGAGIYAMAGPAYEPDTTIALPSAEIAIMGPEAAINAVYYNKIQAVEDPKERAELVKKLQEEYRAGYDIFKLSGELVVDDLIVPSDLREELISRYETFENKDFKLPERKHSTMLS